MKDKLDILICPNCGEKILYIGTQYSCPRNHCFDIAKEGYINLLLPNQKKSKEPGDDKTMVDARQKCLNNGYYQPLRDKICEIIDCYNANVILDAGCGTGYYTNSIDSNKYQICGVDISKHAIKTASKNNKNNLYIVASIFSLPIANESVDLILNVFAPKPKAEFKRILKNNGLIIEVVPGKNHLKELKNIIYKNEFLENKEKYAFENFKLEQTQRLSYTKSFDNTQNLINLLKMTPYWYNGGEINSKLILDSNIDKVTFDFIINIWRKCDCISLY